MRCVCVYASFVFFLFRSISLSLILLENVWDFIYGDTEFSLFSVLDYVFVTQQFFLLLICH